MLYVVKLSVLILSRIMTIVIIIWFVPAKDEHTVLFFRNTTNNVLYHCPEVKSTTGGTRTRRTATRRRPSA